MMSDQDSVSPEQVGGPGKRRTWWHPLLVRLLNHLMATAYEVRDEVLVGRMPLRVDIVLIRREQGQLSAAAGRDLGRTGSAAEPVYAGRVQRADGRLGAGRPGPTDRLRVPVAQPTDRKRSLPTR